MHFSPVHRRRLAQSAVYYHSHYSHWFFRAVGSVGRSCLRGWGAHSSRLCSETSTMTSGTKPREVREQLRNRYTTSMRPKHPESREFINGKLEGHERTKSSGGGFTEVLNKDCETACKRTWILLCVSSSTLIACTVNQHVQQCLTSAQWNEAFLKHRLSEWGHWCL